MAEYFRGSKAEPTPEYLHSLLFASKPSDWLFDVEANVFTYKKDLLIFLASTSDDHYVLRYGHMDLTRIKASDLKDHIGGADRVPS